MHSHFKTLLWILLICLMPYAATAQSESVVLQLKWKHQFQFAGFYMAKEMGFYHDANFDVEIREVMAGKPAVGELLNGHADYAVLDPGVLLARAQGKPVKVLAAIFQHSPLALIVLKDSNIKNFADLEGKRIMFAPGLNADISAALGSAGLKDQDYIRQDSSYDILDLVQRRTDAFSGYVTDQPNQLENLGIPYFILHPKSEDIDFYGDVLATTDALIQQHPERVQAFTEASLKGWQYALQHIHETIAIIEKKYNSQHFSHQQLHFEALKTRDMIESDIVPIGYMREQRWLDIANIYTKQGLIPKDFSVSELLYLPQESLMQKLKGHTWQFMLTLLTIIILFLVFHSFRLRRAIEKTKARIEKTEYRFRSTVEGISDGFFILETDKLVVTYFNQAAEKLLGRSADDVLGKPLFEAFPEAKGSVFDIQYHRAFQETRPLSFETFFGEEPYVNWFDVRVYPVQNGISVFFQTITDRKNLEANLSLNEKRLANAQQIAQLGSWNWDIVSNKLEWSDETHHIFGLDQEEFEITYDAFLSFVHPEDRLELQLHVDAALKGDAYDIEHRIIRKDGVERIVHERGVVHFDNANQPTHMEGTVQDVTEQVSLESRLHHAHKMEALGTLIGGIAHNFNNKIAGVTSILYLANKEASEFPSIQKKIELARSLSFEIAEIIKQLITFSHGDYKEHELVNLNNCIQEALQNYEIPADVSFHVDMIEDALYIEGVSIQIQQSLTILLDNAFDAVAQSTHPMIELSTKLVTADEEFRHHHTELQADAYACIKIKDNGVGISAENMEHIFEPFFTTKDATIGQGLGLSVAYGLIQNHGGTIDINSTTELGTSVHVYLPLKVEGRV